MPTIEKIFPEYIRLDGGTQPRARINQEVCNEYQAQMRSGQPFPRIDVYYDGENYWLADGFHRHEASMLALPGEAMECNLYQGTQQDAQWHSYGVNKTHGLRRTNEDKARAVQAALGHPCAAGKSNYEIAEHCGVDEKTVRKYRNEKSASTENPQMRTRTVTRGKSTYRQNTTSIGKTRNRVSNRKPSRHMATRVATPTRAPVPAEPMTAISMPHNPVMGARTLIEVFDTDYLRAVVGEITSYLKEPLN